MKSLSLALTAFAAALAVPSAAQAEKTYFPARAGAPFSSAVLAGNTLYISGATDNDPATGKPPADPKAGAKLLMDGLQRTLEKAGMTLDDLVWVQVFASDLKTYAAFNEVYRTYFKDKLPARAFIGAGTLLGNANFEIMGTAVKSKP
jgi:2-iminobutanoate/2-iminopropanoate deaminase